MAFPGLSTGCTAITKAQRPSCLCPPAPADLLRFLKQHDLRTIMVPDVKAAAAGQLTSAVGAQRGIKQSTNEVRHPPLLVLCWVLGPGLPVPVCWSVCQQVWSRLDRL